MRPPPSAFSGWSCRPDVADCLEKTGVTVSAGRGDACAGRRTMGRNQEMSLSASSQPPQIKSRLGAILRSTSGNFLEQFDFFLFGFYAPYIAQAFFPFAHTTAALLN